MVLVFSCTSLLLRAWQWRDGDCCRTADFFYVFIMYECIRLCSNKSQNKLAPDKRTGTLRCLVFLRCTTAATTPQILYSGRLV